MKASIFLDQFDRISAAPNAIARFRRFALDLAVRGRLVEQCAHDENAADLYSRIDAERDRLVMEGRLRIQSSLPRVENNDPPFKLPTTWEWVRFGAIADFAAGRTPSRNDPSFWQTGDYPWVSIADMTDGGHIVSTKETVSEKARKYVFGSEPLPIGTIIMSFKLTIGKISVLDIPSFHNEAIISIHPHLPALGRYLFKILPQFARLGETKNAIKGATLNRSSIANICLPLPPLAEQERIVARVDELMRLCDQLERVQHERDGLRMGFAASSHHDIDRDRDDESRMRSAQFFIGNFPKLTVCAKHIDLLRETILNLAVRGQLTPQDPADEPASQLFAKILAVQQQLMTSGKIPRRSVSVSKKHPEAGFVLPKNWEAVTIGSVCNIVTSGSRGWAEYYSKSGPNFIRAQNIRFGRLRLDDLAKVNLPKRTEGTRTQVSVNDLLMVITGAGVTNPALMYQDLGETYVSQHVALIKPTDANTSRWLLLCLMAQRGARAQLLERAYGAGKPGLNLDNIRSLNIPMPPLAEQRRITAKVDELMALCDQLETQLKISEIHSNRLLDAVLDVALNDNEIRDVSHEVTNV